MTDDTIYIVAGGPSLRGYNFNLLRHKRVIAVNRSFEKLPNAEVVYFSDARFFSWFKEGLLAHKGKKISGHKPNAPKNMVVDHPGVINYTHKGHSGLATKEGELCTGNNSTYAAINLAYHMGAKKIVVLGLDMCFDSEGHQHHHEDYCEPLRFGSFAKMLPFFESLATELALLDVVVLNANADSEVDAFERIPLELAHRV